ncbi:hypothetical protein VNO78_25792 [Psophocarpus tetragonolobus]|uniref:Uncharacterized protein n=1 Tax=Psophocarpus tetragonolobus TaxID=3891 RepID=A0AAN9S813_PSOTE
MKKREGIYVSTEGEVDIRVFENKSLVDVINMQQYLKQHISVDNLLKGKRKGNFVSAGVRVGIGASENNILAKTICNNIQSNTFAYKLLKSGSES